MMFTSLVPTPKRHDSLQPVKEKKRRLRADQRLLLRAADIIEKRGWTQENFERDGRVCMIGAINLASTGRPSKGPMGGFARQRYNRALQRVVNVIGYPPYSVYSASTRIWMYNDGPLQTQQRVVETLRRAALR